MVTGDRNRFWLGEGKGRHLEGAGRLPGTERERSSRRSRNLDSRDLGVVSAGTKARWLSVLVPMGSRVAGGDLAGLGHSRVPPWTRARHLDWKYLQVLTDGEGAACQREKENVVTKGARDAGK